MLNFEQLACDIFVSYSFHIENLEFCEQKFTFQDILQMVSYRYVDCKRFLEPDEFVEREGSY